MKHTKEDTIKFFETRIVKIDRSLKTIKSIINLANHIVLKEKPSWFRLDLQLQNFSIKKDILSFEKQMEKLKEQKQFFIERLEELKNPWIQ